MKFIKNFLNWFMLLFGAKSDLTDEAVNEGIISFEGQGRDRNGN